MLTTNLHRALFLLASAGVAAAAACSSNDSTPAGPSPATDGGTTPVPTSTATPDGSVVPDAGAPQAPTFSYHPSWNGVQSVEVFGAFGQSTDWTTPFATLTNDGTGNFTGTGPALAAGRYTYLFKVVGDDAAAKAKTATYPRYAVDPAVTEYEPCPAEAPTYSKTEQNPCSDLTMPQPAAETKYHAKGVVQLSGVPVAGYLVEIERIEPKSHHMFADRTTTGSDGAFDLQVAGGAWRFQVLHPTFLSMTDAQRTDPESYAAVRRSISSSLTISADVTVDPAEVAYSDYASMAPRGSTSLPTTFTFAVPTGTKAHAQIYGPTATIGDPWWVAPLGVVTSDEFDGGFNTGKAPDGGLNPDASYWWGTEQAYAKGASGVVWTAESMVYPVKWP